MIGRSLRILIVNVTLASRTGTETALRDLAFGLKAAGHEPIVYSPELGEIADEIRSSGISVFSQLQDLSEEPDIVHGNHHIQTVEALLQFRHARGLFVCHDRRAHMSAPPRMGRILRYVAVDYNCLERLTEEYGIPQHLVRVIYNSVDTNRFLSRPPLPQHPQRALVLSNYAGPGLYLDTVQQACALLNLPVDVVGASAGNSSSAPELLIGEYDLVFAKARCALEAMAVGAAVVLADTPGLGPLVTSAEVADLRLWNFGARVLREPLDPAGIVRQVQRYDAADAAAVSRYIREHADISTALEQYLHLYDELMNEALRPPTTVARDLDEYLRHTATRMAQMEIELAQYRQPYRMDALPDAACAQLRLSIEHCPESVVCGRTAGVRVVLENRSSEKIGSFPPFPVHLSYRWFRDDASEVVGSEALRTALRPALCPLENASYAMPIAAPDEPGRYRLRVTLVQELVRWFDGLASPLSAEATLVVVSSPAAAGS
jgi:glycosyltransferase involved in cell wall biosynthesis